MLLLAISIFPVLVMVVYRYPKLILWSFPLVTLVDVFFPYTHVFVSGFVLFPIDAVYFLTVLYLGLSIFRQPRKIAVVLRENKFLAVFLLMVAIYVLIFTPVYGHSAIGEARKLYAVFLFPLLASIVIKTAEELRRFVQVVIVAAIVVALAALLLAAMQGSIIRVLNSEATLIIALAAFAMVIHRFHRVIVFSPTQSGRR